MNVDTGEIKPLHDNERPTLNESARKIDENLVSCPKSKTAQRVMGTWGEKKRQRYAQLVKNEGYEKHTAFYCVEFNQGRPL